ncbi:superoxide dismutase family protein [Fuerstiella marisgermanici]|uniref:Superoxide dismutase [Cu-Zn] n=1 Tax=Fuerstiella marisgermanici TaxID=1891926 RepID=A0A1P8WDY0_9PLAN|nr:superoxide dismutase family protein [Fuerstiella marisgermanici]APZ92254.1 Superoxide dismutase [Cu-Zn] precursor [Fuerstiella marisgermanici]
MKTTHFGITATALSGLVIFLAPATAFLQDDDHREKGHHDNGAEREMPTEGVAVLVPTKGNEVFGTLTLQQQDDHVLVRGKVHGLKPGKHGFHIHQFGDLRDPEGKSAGGHYNPHGTKHGAPDDHERHPGDLGNIEANSEGVAEVNKKAKGLKLHFVLGRSFVVHAGMDDLKSQPSGDAGPRVAVGVIGFAEVKK